MNEDVVSRRSLFLGLALVALSLATPAEAQQTPKTNHVAILVGRTLASSGQNFAVFRRN